MITELSNTEETCQRYYTIGLVSLTVFIMIFIAWAGLAKIDSATRASGILASKGNNKIISNIYGGIIKSIDIQDGSLVRRGQTLLVLDSQQEESELKGLNFNLVSLIAKRDRLRTHLNGDVELSFSTSFNTLDENYQQIFEGEKQLFELSNKESHDRQELYNQKIQKFQLMQARTRNTLELEQKIFNTISSELTDKLALLEKGYISKKEYRDQLNYYNKTKSSIESLNSDIEIYQTEIQQNKLSLNEYKKNRLLQLSGQLSEVITDINILESKLETIRVRLEQATIRAPIDGYILKLAHHTIGGTIKAGEKILEIRPQNPELIINARIDTKDINNVSIGMDAKFRVNAFEALNAPSFSGKVSKISADRIVDEQNQAYFLVELTPSGRDHELDQVFNLAPGMGAQVLIVNGESTLLQYLLNPITKVFESSMIEASI